MGNSRAIFLIIISIIIAGCNGMPSSKTFKQAQGKVNVDDKVYTMRIGDFEWKEDDFEAKKISSTDINELADQFKTLEVEEGDKLKIEIEQNPTSIIVNQWNENGTREDVEFESNEITIPSENGYYIYEVIAEWNEGKISYIFDIYIN